MTNPRFDTPMALAIREAYARGEEDETMDQLHLVDAAGVPVGLMEDGDYAIFYNIRGEREVELSLPASRLRPPDLGLQSPWFSGHPKAKTWRQAPAWPPPRRAPPSGVSPPDSTLRTPRFRCSPKKTRPFQCAPVTARATAVSDRYRSPFQRTPFFTTFTTIFFPL